VLFAVLLLAGIRNCTSQLCIFVCCPATSRPSRHSIRLRMFALAPDRGTHWNFREWESLYPVSKATGVSTDLVNSPDLAETYFSLLQSGDLCGKLTVVSWRHDDMPELAITWGVDQRMGVRISIPTMSLIKYGNSSMSFILFCRTLKRSKTMNETCTRTIVVRRRRTRL
jgi:hypothetical protein